MGTILLGGATGKMGAKIVCELNRRNISVRPLTRLEYQDQKSFENAICDHSILVDVTLEDGTASLAKRCAEANDVVKNKIKALIVGSTGAKIPSLCVEIAKEIAVCQISNFSSGMFLLNQLLSAEIANGKKFSDLARELGFELGLIDIHHSQKKDAPSGTAATLGSITGINNIVSLRIGDVIGTHTIIASKSGEEISLTHKANDRNVFASGAVDFIAEIIKSPKKTPGLYLRQDWFHVF